MGARDGKKEIGMGKNARETAVFLIEMALKKK